MANLKVYENGLRLIYDYSNTIKGVSIQFCCLVGGKDEDDSNRGIAHLAEHMFFKGTNKRKSKEINLELDKRGVSTNASTSNEVTKFYATGMPEHAEIIFDIFSDCFFDSTYPREELEKERNVVCSELEMYENDFQNKMATNGEIIGLQGTKYAYVLGGTVESVSKIITEDLLNFRNRFYTPDRLIISVCGSIPQEEAEELIKKYVLPKCSTEKKEPITYHLPIKEVDIKSRTLFTSKETDQLYAVINFRGINQSANDIEAFNLAETAFASTMTSRLFIKLREENGLVYAVSNFSSIYGESGTTGVFFIANEKNGDKVINLIKEAIDEVHEKGFTQEELDTAKNILVTNLYLSTQTITARATKNIIYLMYDNELFDIDKKVEKIRAVTLDEMNKTFNKYYDYKYTTMGLVSKENKDYLIKTFVNN